MTIPMNRMRPAILNPPASTHLVQSVRAMVLPQLQNTFPAFEATGPSIALLVLSYSTTIPLFLMLTWFYVHEISAYVIVTWWYVLGIFVGVLGIIAGVLGIVSSMQPSKAKIMAFMVLNVTISVSASIMVFSCSNLTVDDRPLLDSSYMQNLYTYMPDLFKDLNAWIHGYGIFGVIFYIGVTIVSIYSSVLCFHPVSCCGCCSESYQTNGVVPMDQPAAPGNNYFPTAPPIYSQGIYQA